MLVQRRTESDERLQLTQGRLEVTMMRETIEQLQAKIKLLEASLESAQRMSKVLHGPIVSQLRVIDLTCESRRLEVYNVTRCHDASGCY